MVVTEDDLAGLPEPVQRWLRWAEVVGKPYPATVRVTQVGRFRQSQSGAWMPFTAEEVFTTEPPAFLWKTTMEMLPMVSIVGRDRYVDGRGSIQIGCWAWRRWPMPPDRRWIRGRCCAS